MDHTEDNLTRVEDILYDLKVVEPLKEEAAIAKEYQQLSKQMEQSDVIVTVHDIDQYNEDNRQLDNRLNELKSQQADKEAQQAQINQLLQKFKGERQQIDHDIEKLNYELVKTTETYEQLAGKLNVLEERKKNQSETNARYEEELENLNEHIKSIDEENVKMKRYLVS